MAYQTHDTYQSQSYAQPWGRVRIGRQTLSTTEAVALSTNGIVSATALPAAAGYTTTFDAQPPYPRTLTAVCSGTQTGDIIIYGTDINGDEINETITLTSDTPVASTKAFKSVTKIWLPIKVASETIDVGWSNSIACPFKLSATVSERPYIEATLDGVLETTTPTKTGDASDLTKNLVTLNSSLNGKEVCIYYYY